MNELVSIIIPTFNRKKELKDTLFDLSKQNYKNFEVVVIDTSLHPIKKEEIKESNVAVFYSDNKGSHQSRNIGISKAQGSIIIFIDDDVKIESPNFIESHLKNYRDSKIGGVAGREVQPQSHLMPEKVKKLGKINFFTGRVIGNFNGLCRTEVDHAVGCNMSFRKKILEEIGGFDSIYGGTAYFEETDLCLKIKKKGYGIIFDPEAVLFHLQAKRGGNRAKNFYNWRYWYFHNYSILFCWHFNYIFRPVFFITQGLWIIGSSIKRRDFKNFKVCFSGLIAGYRDWKKSKVK